MTVPGNLSSPLLATAADSAAAAFQISRSLRFSSGDSAYLNRTLSSAGTRTKWSWSGWVKRGKLGAWYVIFSATGTGNDYIAFEPSNRLVIDLNNSSGGRKLTTRVFRDCSAFYHILVAADYTSSTANDRIKVYINGVLEDTFDTNTAPSQNYTGNFGNNVLHNISGLNATPQDFFDGYLAECIFVDGSAIAASDVGGYDSNNVWQPKEYSGTYGTNGFRLSFADNSSTAALGTDSSGNSNTFTVNNLNASDSVSTSAITNVSSTTGTISYSDNNPQAYDPSNLTTFTTGRHSTTQTSIRHVKVSDIGTGSILLEHVSGNNFYITGSNTTSNTNSSPLVHSNYDDFTIDSSFGYAYARIYAGGQGQITYDATVTGPTLPVLTTTNNNNYSELAVGDSNAAGVSITAINSSTPSITVDGGSWSNGDVFTVAKDGDSVFDSPTNYNDGTNVGGNYCTLNPLASTDGTMSDGNLKIVTNSSGYGVYTSTIGMSSGKWYAEAVATAMTFTHFGLIKSDVNYSSSTIVGNATDTAAYRSNDGVFRLGNSNKFTGATFAANDVIGLAFDADAGSCAVYKNGSLQGTATGFSSGTWFFAGSDNDGTTSATHVWNFGATPFTYTPPTNHLRLCTQNLADPTIADGSTAFDTVLYSGDGQTTQTIALPFAPGLLWQKKRSHVSAHYLLDAVRGFANDKALASHDTEAEGVNSAYFTFSQAGSNITVGDYGTNTGNEWNTSGRTHVIWTWNAGASTASNTDGSITTSVRASQTNGFSIITYTGNGTSGATIGHSLNAEPHWVIVKPRNGTTTYGWRVYHKSVGNTKHLRLDTTSAESTYSDWDDTTPTSSVITLDGSPAGTVNENGTDYLCLAWAPVEGYSAFGSYEGTGSPVFVYTGMRPAWVLYKNVDAAAGWQVYDSTRDPFNQCDARLQPNSNGAEDTQSAIDIVSNGFVQRATHARSNASGNTYVYAAFAEHPFRTARAR